MARREIQVFNMSFLDMMTNFLGAVIILFLLSAQNISKAPAGSGLVRKVEGSYDLERLVLHGQTTNVKIGDTLMLVVKDNQSVASSDNKGYANDPKPARPYVDTTEMTKPSNPAEAIIIESAVTSKCNDAGTREPKDDSYTIDIKVTKSGKKGIFCYIDNRLVSYDKNTTLGPFLILNGTKTLSIRDGQNASLTKNVPINPPQPCSNPDPPTPPAETAPPVAGVINFYAKWDDPKDKVNIYVKKGSRWVYGGKTYDAQIGAWSEFGDKNGPFNHENTNVETVRQNSSFIPGTYQIYLHYKGTKGMKQPQKEVSVTLWLINAKYPKETKQFPPVKIPYSKNSPIRGAGKVLVTVEITNDGHFKII